MAASRHDDGELITGINVTPLVDVVLVLLVVLMVTASYIVARTLPMDLPTAATGEATDSVLAISVDARGQLYLDAEKVSTQDLRWHIQRAAQREREPRAMIAADGATAHRHVVRVIDLLRREGVVRFAINVDPNDMTKGEE